MRRMEQGFEISDKAIRLVTITVTVISLVFSAGVSFAAARFAVAQKADRADVLRIEARVSDDSARARQQQFQLDRVEAKVDMLDTRLMQLVCYKNPNPACR